MKGADGGGYGLVQWTPKSDLINASTLLNLLPYDNGDRQLDVIMKEIVNVAGVEQWYSSSGFISHYYNSGATSDMIGITGQQFLDNSMNWNSDKLAILFMSAYERPSYDPSVNHYTYRQERALFWYNFIENISPTPPTPPTPTLKSKHNYLKFLYSKKYKINLTKK